MYKNTDTQSRARAHTHIHSGTHPHEYIYKHISFLLTKETGIPGTCPLADIVDFTETCYGLQVSKSHPARNCALLYQENHKLQEYSNNVHNGFLLLQELKLYLDDIADSAVDDK